MGLPGLISAWSPLELVFTGDLFPALTSVWLAAGSHGFHLLVIAIGNKQDSLLIQVWLPGCWLTSTLE